MAVASTRSSRLTLVRLVLSLVLAACVAAALFPYVSRGGGFQLRWLWAGSALFVLLGWCGPAEPRGFVWLMRLGLIGCALGDYFGPTSFHLGVASFLLAHLLFSVAFLFHGVDWRMVGLRAPLVVVASLLILIRWLWPHLPDADRGLVAAYTAVISVMAVLAGGLRPSPARWLLWTGAWIFYVSDIFVARWRFVDHSAFNGLICYSLYYTACGLLAWGATTTLHRPTERPS